MNYMNQSEAISQLKSLSEQHRQSILIEGTAGCGKTYLASLYSKLLKIPDFQIIEPKVQAIREAITICYNENTPIVLCIENLDLGVLAASYTLLKFIEEPLPNVYIIVTCRNVKQVPDTIISRSSVVTVSPPTDIDLIEYAKNIDEYKFEDLKSKIIWKCVKTFNDVDTVLDLDYDKLKYFESLGKNFKSTDSVYNLLWTIQKYPDGTNTPIDLVLRYLMNHINTSYMWKVGFSCVDDLNKGRISTNAILAKFLFEYKYGG